MFDRCRTSGIGWGFFFGFDKQHTNKHNSKPNNIERKKSQKVINVIITTLIVTLGDLKFCLLSCRTEDREEGKWCQKRNVIFEVFI